ncbi:hypothetical protein GCM10010182_60610 [Actinomadura cremea]|nr:hypothetical protein GCM10010182_60610 [Actinomadura cremea]
MDVEAALDVIEDHGADTWLVNAGGIVAFYPTDLPFHVRNPFLAGRPSGDLLGDAVTAAERRGVQVIARLDLSKVAAAVAAEHPEWLFRSATGEPQIYNALSSTCPAGAYYQERALEILDEILDRYAVGGFFVNWFNFNERDYSEVVHGICHCASCAERFAEFSDGRALPEAHETADLPLWLRYTAATLGELGRKYTDHVASRDRDLALILSKGAPVLYCEGNNAFRHMPGRELWPHATAEAVSAHMSSRPEAPLVLNAAAHVDSTYRMGAEQPEHVAQHLIQAIARGGNPSTYILGAPGRLPMTSVSLARHVTRFHREQHGLYASLRPAATIALVRAGAGRGGHAARLGPLEEFRGVYQSLQERHLPFDVLGLRDLATMDIDGQLDRYRLIVLPDVGALGAEASRTLDAFVERGGNLLTTGGSGTTPEGGVELAASPAARRIGARMSGKEVWSTYATLHEQPHADENRFVGSVVPVYGSNARYVWKPGSDKSGSMLARAPWGPPELSYGHAPSGDPAVASIRYGSGVSSMITWTVGRTYREFAKTEIREHLLSVVEPLADVRVEASLPEQVELVLGRDDEGHVVHLLNQTGVRRRSFGPHVPVGNGHLVLHHATGDESATSLVTRRKLSTRVEGRALVIDLPVIDLFDVISIRSATVRENV